MAAGGTLALSPLEACVAASYPPGSCSAHKPPLIPQIRTFFTFLQYSAFHLECLGHTQVLRDYYLLPGTMQG